MRWKTRGESGGTGSLMQRGLPRHRASERRALARCVREARADANRVLLFPCGIKLSARSHRGAQRCVTHVINAPVARVWRVSLLPSFADDMAVSADINTTYGAILLGSLFAALLSGMVTAQAVVYRKLYPKDSMKVKSLVGMIWSLDIIHSAMIWTAAWRYLIGYLGHQQGTIDRIHWSIAITIMFTAITTFTVHIFLTRRIFLLSRKNYYIAGPIFALAALRLISACVTTGTMVYYGTFSAFKAHFFWVFSLGLALSSIVDIAITVSLFVLLYKSRNGMPHLNAVIDSLILYAFENGSLTCIATVVSMICWVAMNDNFIFLGLHFAIGKLYANTFLATLNARFIVRDGRTTSSSGPVIVLESRRQPPSGQRQEESTTNGTFGIASKVGPVKINVEQTIHYDNERDYDVERK
ncbi:hypothetical protein EV714DRAFT_255770 [Schizophyllum commune]